MYTVLLDKSKLWQLFFASAADSGVSSVGVMSCRPVLRALGVGFKNENAGPASPSVSDPTLDDDAMLGADCDGQAESPDLMQEVPGEDMLDVDC